MFSRIAQLYHRLDGHTKEVVSGTASTFVIRIVGAVFSFALSVVLGRMLGVNGVGLYFLALSVISIATVLGRVGLDNTLLRFTAASTSSGDWVAVKGLYLKGIRFTLVASSLMTIAVVVFAPWLGTTLFDDPNLIAPLRLMALSIVPTALFTIVAQMLQGLKRAKDGIAVLSFWAPAFCLAGAIALVPTWGVEGAALVYSMAAALTAFIAWWRWHKATPQTAGLHGHFSTIKLLKSSMPLFWVSLSQLTITLSATVVLGIWSTSADVGIYGAASRIMALFNFLVLAVSSIASPKFSEMHQQGDMRAVERLAKNSTVLLVLSSSPAFVILFLAPDKVMGLFGHEFVSGATVILILAAGQLVNIVTGPAGNVLMMCGHERMVRNTMSASALICIAVSLLLIPQIGVIGAALANSLTVSIENLIMVALVWRKFGILTIPTHFAHMKRALRMDRAPVCISKVSQLSDGGRPSQWLRGQRKEISIGGNAQSPLIVVGMHRSGTTMVTQLLEQAGLFVGKKKRRNEMEALLFLEINEWLQKSTGGGWDNPEYMSYLLANVEYRALVTDYIRSVLDSRYLASYLGLAKYLRYRSLHKLDFPWGWKDPRNSYTLPIWLDIFPSAKILHIYRNGIDVAQSLRVRAYQQLADNAKLHELRKRRGLYWLKHKNKPFTGSVRCLELDYAFKLWESYTDTAIRNLEAVSNPSFTVKYEDILSDPLSWLTRIVEFCELEITDGQLAVLAGEVRKDRAYAYKTKPELARFYERVQDNPLIRRLGYA